MFRRSLQAVGLASLGTLGIYIYKSNSVPVSYFDDNIIKKDSFCESSSIDPLLMSSLASEGWDIKRLLEAHGLGTGVEFFLKNSKNPKLLGKTFSSLKISEPHLRRLARDEEGRLVYGSDAGCCPPSFLLKPTNKFEISMSAAEKGARQLTENGLLKVEGFLSSSEISEIRKILGIKKNFLNKNSADFETRMVDVDFLAEAHADCQLDDAVFARPHILLRNTQFEPIVTSAIGGLMPLVWAALIQQRNGTLLSELNNRLNSDSSTDLVNPSQLPRVYISDIQLLVTHPCAAKQPWGCDNGGGGLTVLIPLTHHDNQEHGAHLFLPGSHKIRQGPTGCMHTLLSALNYEGAEEYSADPGSIIVCDGRLMKRQRANRSFHLSEATLVVRFDFADKKPPGQNPVTAAFFNLIAGFIDTVGLVYNKLPDSIRYKDQEIVNSATI